MEEQEENDHSKEAEDWIEKNSSKNKRKERKKKDTNVAQSAAVSKAKMLQMHSESARLVREMPIQLPTVTPVVTHTFDTLLSSILSRSKVLDVVAPKFVSCLVTSNNCLQRL